MPLAGSTIVGLALVVLGLVVINFDAFLRRWPRVAERMPPGTPVPPRKVGFYRFRRVSRGYFVLVIGVLFLLDPLLR
jgi:hypothetical protein